MPKPKQARWQKQLRYDEENPSHDKIFDRVNGLAKPRKGDRIPVILQDDVPKDLYFPADAVETEKFLETVPPQELAGLTHIWLRKPKASEFRSGRIPYAEYIRLEGLCVIALYPWPANMLTPLQAKPGDKIMNRYKRWAPELTSHKAKWLVKWRGDAVQDFFLNDLLKGELNHHTELQQKIDTEMEGRQHGIDPHLYARQRFFENTLTIN